MLVVVITGSRAWSDRAAIEKALAGAEALVVGDCPTGADAIATQLASEWDIIPLVHKADWSKHGKSAGPMRNQAMVEDALRLSRAGFEVRCYAFPMPDSVGTYDCRARLKAAGFEVQ